MRDSAGETACPAKANQEMVLVAQAVSPAIGDSVVVSPSRLRFWLG